MWSTGDIYPATPAATSFANLYVAINGPAASFSVAMAGSSQSGTQGSSNNNRKYTVTLNNSTIIDTILNQYDSRISYNPSVSLSLLSSNAANITINNSSIPSSPNPNDRVVCSFVELKYPRLFNFDNQESFAFNLGSSLSNRYLEISNLNAGSSIPVLYDITNQRRYVSDVSAGVARFVILPSGSETKFALVSESASNITPVTAFQTRNFVNYLDAANQGDYLMITHPILEANYAGANQAELYRQYRSSIAGGSYNAKIYDINELVDQFGYGIKKNPMSIKNFLRFGRNHFPYTAQYAFLVGKGLTYNDYRINENNPMADQENLVPTFGYPASDVLLASNNLDPVMNTYISRLSVVSPQELSQYLDKVKQYDQAQQSPLQTLADKAWMKNVVHVIGSNDDGIYYILKAYMNGYQTTIQDTSYGGNVYNFDKVATGPATPIVNSLMATLFQTGIGLLTYFGHSSATSLDYNLDDPYNYNNTGKYPLFLVSGCNAGDLYYFDPSRFTNLSTLSERFVLANQKGGIGFIASTHFGIDTYLDYFNRNFYKSMSTSGYGKTITANMSEAINAMNAYYLPGNSFFGRVHAEQTTLNGDPALKMNNFPQPDYVVEESQIQVIPNILSVADPSFTVKAKVYNIGKAIGDSVSLQVKRKYGNGLPDTLLFSQKWKPIKYEDSITIVVPMKGLRESGSNQIVVTVDYDNKFDGTERNKQFRLQILHRF